MPENGLVIRRARPGEAAALTELCRRSKAHWGYDAAFMKAAARTIRIQEGDIGAGSVLVAERETEPPLGVAVIQITAQAGTYELSHLFVAPEAFNQGIGRALFLATARLAGSRGGRLLSILSDPHAAGFYQKLGARLCGQSPSDAIPGRTLPRFEFAIEPGP